MRNKKYLKKAVTGLSAAAVGITAMVPAIPVMAAEPEPDLSLEGSGGSAQVQEQTAPDLSLENIAANDYVLYTVNCGTPDPSVVPNQESERLGILQSNVDQEYGEDAGTGYTWGRDPSTEYSRAEAYGEDSTDMGNSYIYMSEDAQFDKYKSSLGYSFQLPEVSAEGLETNTYEVTVAFKHYWDDRTLNILLEEETVATDVSVDYGAWVCKTFTTVVEDGELNVDVKAPRRTDPKQDPILNYIKVRAVPEQEKETPIYSSFTGVAGETMYDTEGKPIQAHGGQIQQLTVDGEKKWYWIGEDKTNDYRPCGGIHMYTSTDLYNWTDEGIVLKTMENPEQFETDPYFEQLYGDGSQEQKDAVFIDLDKNNCVMERPKMLYNEKNDNYVIWFHADGRMPGSEADYGKAKAGVAVSDSPTGPFKLLGSYKLHHAGDNYGYDGWENRGSVRDMNLFQDDDGTAYVIYSSEGNQTMYVAKLNEDYTGLAADPETAVEGEDFTRNFVKWSREAPAMFKYKDKYYIITSGCTGWNPNQAKYAVADHPMGPWTEVGDPCTDWGWETTYDTQSTCVFPVDAENGKYIYMGDRWNSGDLSESRYVWLPVEFQPDSKIALRRYENWTLEDLNGKGSFEVMTDLPKTAASVDEILGLLPSQVTISYGTEEEATPVEWSLGEYDEKKIGTVTVTGSLTEKGSSFQHEIFVIHPDTRYFFDSGAEESPYFNAAKGSLGAQILNESPDEKYTKENKAGYTGTTEAESSEDFDIGLHEGGNELESGWWAAGDKTIGYAFELQPGTYTLSAGFQEWWDATRDMKLKITMEEETLGEQDFILYGDDKDLQVEQEFQVDKAGKVVVTISKNGSSDPVLSWLAVTGKEEGSQEPEGETDKTSLNLAIAMAEKLELEQKENQCYTEASWKEVEKALGAARAVTEDPEAVQEEVDEAFLNLITACNMLENGVQKVGLKAAIEGTKAVLAEEESLGQYTPESVDAVRTALAEAEKIFAESSADQETVNAATRSLMDAVTSLLLKEEQDTRLDILIQKAEELLKNKDIYTQASVGALETALEAAKEIAEDHQVSPDEIQKAYQDLAQAMASLVRKAEKSELKNALDKADAILADSQKYVADTIGGLQEVRDEAQAVYEKDDADASEVGQAVKKLVEEILKARLLGDVDGNGVVDSADSAEILKYTAEYQELTEEQHKAADVDLDGTSDSSDAAKILQFAAEEIENF